MSQHHIHHKKFFNISFWQSERTKLTGSIGSDFVSTRCPTYDARKVDKSDDNVLFILPKVEWITTAFLEMTLSITMFLASGTMEYFVVCS